MIVLDSARIGPVRLRLVERPALAPELASTHYIVGDDVRCRRIVAIEGAGYNAENARQAMYYYIEREQARLAIEQDDGT